MKIFFPNLNRQTVSLALILFSVLVSCDSSKNEELLLNKKNPIGLYGKAITKKEVNGLKTLFSNPDIFINKEVLTKGKIIDVCPLRGCWINISDSEHSEKAIRVKVIDGEIVFPLSSKGKNANVQGVFDKIEFSYEQAKKWKIHLEEEKGIYVNPDSIIVEDDDLIEYRIIGKGVQIF